MRNTLTYNVCKACKKHFSVGNNSKLLINYCPRCETVGWLEEMKSKGCTVGDHSKLGDMPRMVAKKKSDCPVIEIKGIQYRDVTELCFMDGRYKKTYPTMEEIKQIQTGESKRIKYEQRKKRKAAQRGSKEVMAEKIKIDYERLLLEGKEGADLIENLLKRGYKGPAICDVMKITRHFYNIFIEQLKSQGRVAKYANRQYTKKEELDILKMSSMGYIGREIGEKYGVSEVAINEKLRRLKKARGIG